MQRVVSINLNGNAYQLEENGYNALFAYLDATEAQLKDSPERVQTLADLERAVAEKCQAVLGPHKTVITSQEIDRIILELGPIPGQPAAGSGPSAASNSTNTTAGSTSTEDPSTSSQAPRPDAGPTHRRLYQIRDGAMISGVCVGLSEFLHIDATLIRILFVVFTLVTQGFGILAYAVLMFVVPKVNTRADASDGAIPGGTTPPHHWPWDNGWPWDTHGWPWDGEAPHDWRDTARDAARQARQAGRDAAREARRAGREARRAAYMAHPAGSAFGTIGLVIGLMFAFFWLSFWTRGHFFFGWPYVWGVPHWIGIVVFFMMMRLIVMPFRMARWHSYGYGPYGPYGPYGHPHHAWVSMWNGLAWFALMMFAVWAAFHYIPEVRDFVHGFQTSWSDGGFNI